MTTKVGLYKDERNKRRPWVVRWFGEYDPEKGKARPYYDSFKTKREAETFRAEKQAELDRGGQRDRPPNLTVGEFAARFLTMKGKGMRAASRKAYRSTLDQLEKHFGTATPIRKVSRELADHFIATRDRVAEQGDGFSPASRNHHLRNCKAVFRVAVQWEHISANPFSHIRSVRESPQPWHHLRPGEFHEILRVVTDLRWRAFYLLAYTTGARFGELFSLTWADVDFGRCCIAIRDRPATRTMPPFFVKDYEARTLLLPAPAIEALLAWQAAAPEVVPYVLLTSDRWGRVRERWQLCRAGQPWKRNRRSGKLEWADWQNQYMVNNVVRDMNVHVRRAGLDLTASLNVHSLRKSFAQNHADSGTPIHVLQKLMGHASVTTTEKYYLQRSDENEAAAVKRYEALLSDETAVKLLYTAPSTCPSDPPESATSFPSTTSELRRQGLEPWTR